MSRTRTIRFPFTWTHDLIFRSCLNGRCTSSRLLCFILSTAPIVFNRVFAMIFGWAHGRGICLLWYLDDWLGEVKPRTIQQGLVTQGADKHHFREIFLIDTLIVRFQDVADKFLRLSPPAKMWQQLLGHVASLE